VLPKPPSWIGEVPREVCRRRGKQKGDRQRRGDIWKRTGRGKEGTEGE